MTTTIAGMLIGFLCYDRKAGWWNVARILGGVAALMLSYYAGMEKL